MNPGIEDWREERLARDTCHEERVSFSHTAHILLLAIIIPATIFTMRCNFIDRESIHPAPGMGFKNPQERYCDRPGLSRLPKFDFDRKTQHQCPDYHKLD